MADFFDQNPYLRRYQITPEQQQAYGRYILARMRGGAGVYPSQAGMPPQPLVAGPAPGVGIGATGFDSQPPRAVPFRPLAMQPTGAGEPSVPAQRDSVASDTPPVSETPPTGASVQPDRPPTPNPGLQGSLPAPLPVGAMQPNGFAVHPNPNAPTNMPVSPASMQPSAGRRALDEVGNILSTDINWLETRASKLLGGIAGTPRKLTEGAEAAAQYFGVPPDRLAFLSAYKKYLPTDEEASNFSRRGFGILPYVPPNVDLPGRLGAVIDKGTEGALGTLLTGGGNIPSLLKGALVGAGSEIAGQLARLYDQKLGTNTEKQVRLMGDVYGFIP